jgi:hypothetical protein
MPVQESVVSSEATINNSPKESDSSKKSDIGGTFYSAQQMQHDKEQKPATPIHAPPGYIVLGAEKEPAPIQASEAIIPPATETQNHEDTPFMEETSIEISTEIDLPAKTFPKNTHKENSTTVDASQKEENLIGSEDRREIEEQIAELSRKNRIDLGPDQLKIKPQKGGGRFILLVNLFIIVLTGGVLWVVSELFTRQENAIIRGETNTYTSVEGQLLQRLRSESDFRISEKERELADLQNRLTTIEQEELLLEQTFEARLQARELEYQDSLQRELAAERARLIAAGLSEGDINERLRIFERERAGYYQTELTKYKVQVEAERQAEAENYARMRNQYQSELNTINDDRRRMQEEFRQREAELRAELQQNAAAAQATTAQTAAPPTQTGPNEEALRAQAELTRLAEQRERSRIEEERIISMFTQVRGSLQERQYESAADQAAALRTYLESSSLESSDTLQNRRRTDIFLAGFLASAARTEANRNLAGEELLLSQAQLISRIREITAQAQADIILGNGDRAQEGYREALSLIPDVLTAHTWLTNREQAAAAQRLVLAGDSVRAAAEAAERGDRPGSMESYHDAGVLLGLSQEEADTLVSGIEALSSAEAALNSAGNAEAQALQVQNATAGAAPLITKGSNELNAQQWRQALTTYSLLISAYPLAEQIPQALSGMGRAFDGALSQSAETLGAEEAAQAAETASLRQQATSLQQEAASLRSEIERLNQELKTAQTASAAAAGTTEQANQTQNEEIARLTQALKEEEAALLETNTALQATNTALQQSNTALEQITAEANRNRPPAESYREVIDAWNQYAAIPSPEMAELQNFLTANAVGNAFPGFMNRIETLTENAALAGHREGISNILDIIETALRIRNLNTRQQYFSGVKLRYAHDAKTAAFIDVLQNLLQEK